MHKKPKHLIKNIKDVFDIDEINKMAKETKFVRRKSNIRGSIRKMRNPYIKAILPAVFNGLSNFVY
jgi:hypothetical protein